MLHVRFRPTAPRCHGPYIFGSRHGESLILLLTICGSLRAKSSNATLLDALVLLATSDIRVERYDRLADVPLFNPDIDVDPGPPSVVALRNAIARADALLISSPEYAHGVPGALKNALDWLVSGVEILDKPVALVNPSPMSRVAQPQLMETLRVMSARVVDEACVTVPIAGRDLDATGIVADAEMSAVLLRAVEALLSRVARTG
jgi:NAD(P)H-dependent FMN reductase